MNDRFPEQGGPEDTRLSYKFQRLREQLRQAIRQRELTGRLPGERELGRRFHANAKTINKALSDLSAEGLVVRYVGRGTFVVGAEVQEAVDRPRNFWWIPSPTGPDVSQSLFERVQAEVATEGSRDRVERMDVDTLEVRSRGTNGHGLGACSGVVFFGTEPGSRVMASLLRRHIPTVMIGGATESARVDTVQVDDADAGFQLAEHLIQTGYRRVHVVAEEPQSAWVDRVMNGYRAACLRRQIQPGPAIAASDLRRMVTDLTDQALLVVGSGALQTVMDLVQALPARQQPAVVSLPDIGERTPEQWQLTSYDAPAERVVEWAVRLLRDWHPGQLPMQVLVPGRLTARAQTRRPGVVRDVARPTTDAIL